MIFIGWISTLSSELPLDADGVDSEELIDVIVFIYVVVLVHVVSQVHDLVKCSSLYHL